MKCIKKGNSTKRCFSRVYSEVLVLELHCGTLRGADPVDLSTWGALLGGWGSSRQRFMMFKVKVCPKIK